jgi:hypothetical protein
VSAEPLTSWQELSRQEISKGLRQKTEANTLNPNRDLAETSLQDTREALYLYEVTLSSFIYSYDTDQLQD